MVLSDRDIKARLKKDLVISPLDKSCIQPSSVDVHLGEDFLVFDNYNKAVIDLREGVEGLMRKIIIKGKEPIIIHPRDFILATTSERVEIPADLVGRLEGKSSLGRIGLIIHSTAGYLDPGFKGQITLEISNLANLPILLYKGMRIGQVSFTQMTSPAEVLYGSKKLGSHYQNQKGTTGSKVKI